MQASDDPGQLALVTEAADKTGLGFITTDVEDEAVQPKITGAIVQSKIPGRLRQ